MNTQLKIHPLEERRRVAGLRATELSRRSGVPISTISGIENRRYLGRILTLRKLATALGCQAGDLVEDGNVQSES